MDTVAESIINTLIYADIFGSPLTKDELYLKLHGSSPVSFQTYCKALMSLVQDRSISEHNGFYFLWGKESLVPLRLGRIVNSKKKLELLKKDITWLRYIPGIEGIFLTGSIAVQNSLEDDDIDLLIIVREGMLWWTRFLVLLISDIKGRRRKPNSRQLRNRLCFNLFLDTTSLSIPHQTRNLFTAHEVLQAVPLVSRNQCYDWFIRANNWTKDYLCHLYKHRLTPDLPQYLPQKPANGFTQSLNKLFFVLQRKYMARRHTTETISLKAAFFHPGRKDQEVVSLFEAGKKCFGLI